MFKHIYYLYSLLLIFIFSNIPSPAYSAKTKDIKVDGSSTVFPITEAIAEEYREKQPNIRVTIGVSGTGGGFKKFLAKETDINNASRKIKGKEISLAKKRGIEYLELPVAYDGITVIINKKNTWAQTITTKELKKIWESGSKIKKWSDIRKSWPNEKIDLFGPGTDSGTFDYFTKVINGKEHSSRSDYTMSEDDNVLVKGVIGNQYALGYLGYSYYAENKNQLKSVAIDSGKGGVQPTLDSINNGTYAPLSRPIFIYVSKNAAKKKEIRDFVHFYLETVGDLVQEVGYVPLTKTEYKKAEDTFDKF